MFDLNLKKIAKSAGIDLEKMQKDAKQVPALLEALVKQNNAQVKAIKEMQDNQAVMMAMQIKIFDMLKDIIEKRISA